MFLSFIKNDFQLLKLVVEQFKYLLSPWWSNGRPAPAHTHTHTQGGFKLHTLYYQITNHTIIIIHHQSESKYLADNYLTLIHSTKCWV